MIQLELSDNCELLKILPGHTKQELEALKSHCTVKPMVYTSNGWTELPEQSYMYQDKAIAGGLWRDIAQNLDYVQVHNQNAAIRTELLPRVQELKEYAASLLPSYFVERPYQIEAPVISVLYRKSAQVLGTSAGKTICAYMSIQLQRKLDIAKKVLVLVPDNYLASQMYNEFVEDFLPATEEKFTMFKLHTGAHNDIAIEDADVVIATYSAMYGRIINEMRDAIYDVHGDKYDKKQLKDKRLVQFLFDELKQTLSSTNMFDSIIVDEAHKVKIDTIKSVFRQLTHIKQRYGFSGSIKPQINDFDRMTLQAYIGAITYEVTVKFLIDNGWATKLYMHPVVLHAKGDYVDKWVKRVRDKARPDDADSTIEQRAQNTELLIENKALLQLRERQFVAKSKDYAKFVANFIANLEDDANAVIFEEGVTEQVHTMAAAVKERFPDRTVHVIYGATPDSERVRIVNEMRAEPNGHVLIASVSTMGTGKSIHTLKYMILANVSKSFYQTLQVIGRMLRQHPNKSFALVIDLAVHMKLPMSVLNSYKGGISYCKASYMSRHQKLRLIEYKNEEHPVSSVAKIHIDLNE